MSLVTMKRKLEPNEFSESDEFSKQGDRFKVNKQEKINWLKA